MVTIPMVSALQHWATERPETPALTVGDTTLSFGKLDDRSERLAHALQRLGVQEGDYVTLAFPNSIAFIESAFAILKLGAVVQPVSGRLPLSERQDIVELADARVVIGAQPGDHPGRVCVPDLVAITEEVPEAPLPLRVSQPWRATTSGGSTGRPKLIVGIPPAVLEDLDKPDYLLPVASVVMIPGPLYHGGPFLIGMAALCHGNHLILGERFDPAQTLSIVVNRQVEYLLLVPTMMHRIWRLPPEDRPTSLPSLSTLLHLASACPRWLKEAWLDWLGPERVYELYGAADAPNRTIISGPEWLARPGSVGLTRPDEFKITDDHGNVVPAGTTGEIWMRAPAGRSDRSYLIGAEQRKVDGWTSVGDLGWIDPDGYLFVADRRTDMIVVGGENVFPAEVEAALDLHPGVRSSAVVGVDDEDLGRRVHAVVEVEGDVTEADLRAHMSERLARHKNPRTYQLVDHPVRDEAGKVRKNQLTAPGLPPLAHERTIGAP